MQINKWLIALFLFWGITTAKVTWSQNSVTSGMSPYQSQSSVEALAKHAWVDSVYKSLTQEQRIGQLFMIAAYSGGENYNEDKITQLIKNNYIGGLIFMQGTAEKQAALTNKYQKLSKVPLLIGMDAEWGLGMRLTGVKNFPRQMMLGATRDQHLVYQLGQLVAEQCHLLGVHMNFAPTIDINNNPDNPVINFRSFGESKDWVTTLGMAYMRGLQDNQVLACAKHFPGHGDVSVDSHLDLPVINKPIQALDTLELAPFQSLIQAGISSVMIAHLSIPALDSTPHTPTTLSYNVVTNLLVNRMHFKGLVITDALNMKGVTKYYQPGEVDVKAFMAGNDILLFSEDVPQAVQLIKQQIDKGVISPFRLEYSVKKILAAKYDVGLHQWKSLEVDGLTEKLNQHIRKFFFHAAHQALTSVHDKNQLIHQLNAESSVAYFPINTENTAFFDTLKNNFPTITTIKSLQDVDKYDIVIIGVHDLSLYPGQDGQYKLSAASIQLLQDLQVKNNTITVLFGNPYASKFMCQHPTLWVTYEENEYTYQAVVDALLHKHSPLGQLPVSVCQ